MTAITHARMRSQRLTGALLATPEEVVYHLGAVQAQDFAPGKWSIAQRAGGVTDADVDEAIAAGTILRTHILRPTWHFVLPEETRWMLELTAPRVQALNSHYYRRAELDEAIFTRCNAVLEATLRDGQHHTRAEIGEELELAGVAIDTMRLGLILMNAELSAIICSGTPRGKKQTYALLAERAPNARRLTAEEALADLTLRYFTGHGPATVKDFRWWSGLTMAAITRGLALVTPQLEQEIVDGVTYWSAPSESSTASAPATAHLLPGYDEYIVGYGESKYLIDCSGAARSLNRPRGIYTNSIILDGQVAGQWRPALNKRSVAVEQTLFRSIDDVEREALHGAVRRYSEYLGVPLAS